MRNDEQQRDLLRSVAVLSALSDTELDQLLPSTSWIRVSRGQEVLSHLATSTQIYFLIEGVFSAQMVTAHGKTVAIRKMHAGAHVGEIAALTGAPRSVTIVADTDGLIAEWSAETFKQAMHRCAPFAEAIAASLARNVVLLTDRLFEFAALEVRFRLYAELLRLARRGELVDAGVLIGSAPTHAMIASSIGTNREAVTRELNHLASEGVIQQSKRELLIKDLVQLQKMVEARAGRTATQVVDWRA